MKLLKLLGSLLMFLIHVVLTLAGLALNIFLFFIAILASAYMKS